MKKLLLSLVLCLGLGVANIADAQVMSKGTILVSPNFNLGYYGGFGYAYYGGYNRGFTPGGTVNVDIGVHDYVSVGPYVAFAGRNGYSNIAFGARGNFHFGNLIYVKKGTAAFEKLDLYYSLGLGGRITTYKNVDKSYYTPFRFGFSSSLGVRYYFADWVGVQAEFGATELSWLKLGVTFKLGGKK